MTINPLRFDKYYNWILAISSGVLLGLSFPPSPLYSLAYIAFIPIFFLFIKLDSYRNIVLCSYVFLFVFNLITAYWIGGFAVGKDIWMMVAGSAFILVHPIFYLPFILFSFAVKRKMGPVYGLISFAILWTSFEYLHSLSEYAFPWFTIGNSQAYDIYRIQIAEYASVYGLTLLLFCFNIVAFLILWKYSNNELKLYSLRAVSLFIVLMAIYFAPEFFGRIKVHSESMKIEDKINVGIIQPNFDPWEKWGEHNGNHWDSYLFQFNTFIEESKKIAELEPDIIIWPETAVPFYILLPRYSMYFSKLQSFTDSLQIPIFTGLPTVEYFDSINAPATAQRIWNSSIYVESYNSAILIQTKRIHAKAHKKTILVPFAERIPYAETFRFLIEPLKWNVGISSWGKGADTLVYSTCTDKGNIVKFSGMICYESVFPQYVREFVKRGAEFLVIITNDSWWGNTSGAYQHASFASLRAVETRRWVVQCSNGGISLVVDPVGVVRKETKLYTSAKFADEIGVRKDTSFYVKHGDVVGQICLCASILFVVALLIQKKRG